MQLSDRSIATFCHSLVACPSIFSLSQAFEGTVVQKKLERLILYHALSFAQCVAFVGRREHLCRCDWISPPEQG